MQSMLLSKLGFLIRHGRFMSARSRARIPDSLCVEPVQIPFRIGPPQRHRLELETYLTEEFTVPVRVKGTSRLDEGASAVAHGTIRITP